MQAAATVRRKLARWYEAGHRDLPWRRTRDPYAIWISEIMLQQTRVAAVIPYYERFLARFPNVGALAAAPIGITPAPAICKKPRGRLSSAGTSRRAVTNCGNSPASAPIQPLPWRASPLASRAPWSTET
jgi:hypothetical protein